MAYDVKIYQDIGTKYAAQGKTEAELVEYVSDASKSNQKHAIDAYNEVMAGNVMIIEMTPEAEQILGNYNAGFDNKKIASMMKLSIASVDFTLEQLKMYAFI